jgi:hypothetical protein
MAEQVLKCEKCGVELERPPATPRFDGFFDGAATFCRGDFMRELEAMGLSPSSPAPAGSLFFKGRPMKWANPVRCAT